MKHGILGPGGVGGLFGAVLADAGEEVTMFVRPGSEPAYPREIALESPFKNLRAPVSVSAGAGSPVDILWITVKATQLSAALERLPKEFQARGVVPLLNGVDHLRLLRERFGDECVIPATVAVESERVAPGKIVQRSPFVRLNVHKSGEERLASAVQIFQRFGFECQFVPDEVTLMWSKLVFLAPFALTTSAARSPIGDVLSDALRAAQLETSVHEACAVAAREGARVNPDAVLARITSLPRQMRSSMERDVANGNTPELDAIAGPIIRGAQKHGIVLEATPRLVSDIGAASPVSS